MVLRFEIKTASSDVKARAKGFHAYERGPWVIVLTEPNKDDRGVLFEGSKVSCYSSDTGEQCPANQFGNVCAHVYAADKRKRINAKRRATIQQKRQQHQVAA